MMRKQSLTFILIAIALGITITVFTKTQAVNLKNTQSQREQSRKIIYLAGGCFWGTEHFFKQVRGVLSTEVGYANGHKENPTYEEVCQTDTGFAEAVCINYDPNVIDLDLLLELFFQTINPTSLNKQGGDIGTQYRTGIYHVDETDIPTIRQALAKLQAKYTQPIVIEQKPLSNFYPAEAYHQDYLENNPRGYCHIRPELFTLAKAANPEPKKTNYKRKEKDELQRMLTPIQYAVTQQGATEQPYNNDYWNEHRSGIYVDITTGEPLFSSNDKFDSGCGWPSFSRPISEGLIKEHVDTSHGMIRTEVRSQTGDAHLGHVFEDGPMAQGGLRYCINSAALRFIPKEQMQAEGYEAYLSLVK